MDDTYTNKRVKKYTSYIVCEYKIEDALNKLIELATNAPLKFLELHETYEVVSKFAERTLQCDLSSDASEIVRIIDSRREQKKKAKMDKHNDEDKTIPLKMTKLTEVRKASGNEGKPVSHSKSSFKVGDPLDSSDLEVTPGKIMYPGLRPVPKKPGPSTGTKLKEMLSYKDLSHNSSNLPSNLGEIKNSTTFEIKESGKSYVEESMIKRKRFIPRECFKTSESDASPLKTQRLDMDMVLSDDLEDSKEQDPFSLPFGDPFNLNAILAKGNDSSPENGSIQKNPDCSKQTRYKPLGGLDLNETFLKPKKTYTKVYAGKSKAAEKMLADEDLNNNSSSENLDSLNKPPTPALKPTQSLEGDETTPKRRISHLQQNSGKSETVEKKLDAKESDNNSSSNHFGRLTFPTDSKTCIGLDKNESKIKPREPQHNNRKSDTAKAMLVVKKWDNSSPSKNVDRFANSEKTNSKPNRGLDKIENKSKHRESYLQINTGKSDITDKVLAVGDSDDDSSDEHSPSELLATIEKYDQYINAAEKKFAKFIKREFPGKEKEKPFRCSYREWYRELKSAKEKLENSTRVGSVTKKPENRLSKVGPPSLLSTNQRIQRNAVHHRQLPISKKPGNSTTGCKPTVVPGKKVEWSDGVPAGIGRIPKKVKYLRKNSFDPTAELDKKRSKFEAPNPYLRKLDAAEMDSTGNEYDPAAFHFGTRPSHVQFDSLADEAEKLSSADLITFLRNNERFKKDADWFFIRFITEEFPGKLRRKPEWHSYFQWYQSLKRGADMQVDLSGNNFSSSIKTGTLSTSNKTTQVIDEVHREVKRNNSSSTSSTANIVLQQRKHANYDVYQTEKTKSTVSSPERNDQPYYDNPKNGSRPSTGGETTKQSGQPTRPEKRKAPMSEIDKKCMRDAQNRHR